MSGSQRDAEGSEWRRDGFGARTEVGEGRGRRGAMHLGQERLKHVDEVEDWRPRLVDDVQAHGAPCLIHVGVVYLVSEPDGGRLVRVRLQTQYRLI